MNEETNPSATDCLAWCHAAPDWNCADGLIRSTFWSGPALPTSVNPLVDAKFAYEKSPRAVDAAAPTMAANEAQRRANTDRPDAHPPHRCMNHPPSPDETGTRPVGESTGSSDRAQRWNARLSA
ncbi:MAG: hypothetical protein AMXMBFR58_35530 [Phycisphaerae bacterium]